MLLMDPAARVIWRFFLLAGEFVRDMVITSHASVLGGSLLLITDKCAHLSNPMLRFSDASLKRAPLTDNFRTAVI